MSSLDYMRGDKQIKKDRARTPVYKTLNELKDGAKLKAGQSRKIWREFKEGLNNGA